MDFTELVLAGVGTKLPNTPDGFPEADAIAYQVSGEAELSAMKQYDGELPIIATNWLFGEENNESNQGLHALKSAADLEVVEAVEVDRTAIENNDEIIEDLNASGVKIIASYRNFSETPDVRTLVSLVMELAEYSDLVYIETMAESGDDCLSLLRTINEVSESGIPIGGACMGEVGRHTRVVAPSYGSKLAYASIGGNENIGTPGQFPLSDLAELIQESEDPSTPTSLSEDITNPLVRDME